MRPEDTLITKHVKTINEQSDRIYNLEQALEKYGKHLCEDSFNCCPLAWKACQCERCVKVRKQTGTHNKCTCGLDDLKGDSSG
jgi:hypothetical protein